MRFITGIATDIGPRSYQQDRAGVAGNRLVLCDGMGGRLGGGEAATAALDALLHGRSLRQGFDQAAAAVTRLQATSPDLSRAGTTAVAAEIQGSEVLVGHVGDSRAYLISGKDERLLTIDQSIAGGVYRGGGMTLREFLVGVGHPGLIGAIGGGGVFSPEFSQGRVHHGDVIVLTSDGVHPSSTRATSPSSARVLRRRMQPRPCWTA